MARYSVAVIEDVLTDPGERQFLTVAVLIREGSSYRVAWRSDRLTTMEVPQATRDAWDYARSNHKPQIVDVAGTP